MDSQQCASKMEDPEHGLVCFRTVLSDMFCREPTHFNALQSIRPRYFAGVCLPA
jgi:hypothetical protein